MRFRVIAAAGFGAAFAAAAIAADTPRSEAAITCTNPASGASWRVVIDYRRATVDANPAEITEAAISWFDPRDGGNYTLDRRSGNLTASVASSTGGYFRHGRCMPEQAR